MSTPAPNRRNRLTLYCLLGFIGAVVLPFSASAQFESDLSANPATAKASGFVVTDDLPELFRTFAVGSRHLVTFNAARMADSPGFLVSHYLPSHRQQGPQVGVTMTAGKRANWLVSIVGNRATTSSSSSSVNSNATDTNESSIERLRSNTSSVFRLARRVGRADSRRWKGAVGIRLGLQRSDRQELSSLSSSFPLREVSENRFIQQYDSNSVEVIDDHSILRGALEVSLFNGRTDLVLTFQTDYHLVENTDRRRERRFDYDSTSGVQPQALVDIWSFRQVSVSERASSRPAMSAGFALRSQVADRGRARHFVVVAGGARLHIGSEDLESLYVQELSRTITDSDQPVLDGSYDSTSAAPTVEPLDRTIFGQAGYVHVQDVGKATVTTGVGASAEFGLAKEFMLQATPGGDALETSAWRGIRNEISWLVPAFVDFQLAPALKVFAGAVFDLEYRWSQAKTRTSSGAARSESESQVGTLTATYHAGLMVDQAGFFGQIGFSGDLARYQGWRISLGLDL